MKREVLEAVLRKGQTLTFSEMVSLFESGMETEDEKGFIDDVKNEASRQIKDGFKDADVSIYYKNQIQALLFGVGSTQNKAYFIKTSLEELYEYILDRLQYTSDEVYYDSILKYAYAELEKLGLNQWEISCIDSKSMLEELSIKIQGMIEVLKFV